MIESEMPRPLLRRLISAVMVCNPLLLLSPMFLLYGVYRAVVAPNLFSADTGNTIFNFVALAIYVLMVCVTATLLARKAIVPLQQGVVREHDRLALAQFRCCQPTSLVEGQLGPLPVQLLQSSRHPQTLAVDPVHRAPVHGRRAGS